jgi:AraC-like DNA-binding protein
MKKIFREIASQTDASIIVKQEKAAQFAAPFHFHDAYEFTYIVKGQGKFYGGNRLMNFTDGDIYFFGPGFPHYFVNEKVFVQSGEQAHSIAVQFGEDCLGRDFFLKPELKTIKGLLKTAQHGIKINKPNDQINTLIYALTEQKGIKELILFIQLLDEVSTLPKDQLTIISPAGYKHLSDDESGNKLDVVYKYVLENFKGDVNTKKAAGLAYMNEAAFCRYFKRRTKKTLSQFVNDVRITHATYLLEEKDMSISEICFECGFENLSYFNRQFKFILNKTPFAYRRDFSEL